MKIPMFCINLFRRSPISPHLRKLRRLNVRSPHYSSIPYPVCSSSFFVALHSCAILNAKYYQEKENEYAHTIMERLSSYDNSIVKNLFSCEYLPNSSPLVKDFIELSCQAQKHKLSLEETKYIPLIARLTNTMPQLSDEDIILILQHLCFWPPSPKSFSRNYKRIWNTIDFQCIQRLPKWDLNRKLLVADYFFHLRLNRISQYNKTLIVNLLQNLPTLSDSQIVQLMFYINLQREVPQMFEYVLEKKLLSVVSSVSLEEVGIICLGFFKTKSKINNFDVIQSILKRLLNEIGQVNTLTVGSVLKFLRKSMQLSRTQSYIPLLHKSILFVSNLDIPTSTHLALLSAECHVFHPLLLQTITEKISDDIENARIKDCKKLLQCLSHFNYYSSSKFHELYISELKKDSRKREIEEFPRDLAYTALFYAYLGYFNYEIINTVLEPNFVQDCKMRNPETKNSFAEIDYCIEIECEDYNGHRLNKEEIKQLKNRRGNFPINCKSPNTQMRLMSEIAQSLELAIGKNNVFIRHVLPHIFSPDIIVRLSGGSKSLSELCDSFPSECVLKPPSDEVWACFVIAAPFAFAYKSNHLTGATIMKLRQLKKLNYKTVLAPFYDVPRDSMLRMAYVKRKIDELLKECDINMSVKLCE